MPFDIVSSEGCVPSLSSSEENDVSYALVAQFRRQDLTIAELTLRTGQQVPTKIDLAALPANDGAAAGQALVDQITQKVSSALVPSASSKSVAGQSTSIEQMIRRVVLLLGNDTFMSEARDSVEKHLPGLGRPEMNVEIEVMPSDGHDAHCIVVTNATTWKVNARNSEEPILKTVVVTAFDIESTGQLIMRKSIVRHEIGQTEGSSILPNKDVLDAIVNKIALRTQNLCKSLDIELRLHDEPRQAPSTPLSNDQLIEEVGKRSDAGQNAVSLEAALQADRLRSSLLARKRSEPKRANGNDGCPLASARNEDPFTSQGTRPLNGRRAQTASLPTGSLHSMAGPSESVPRSATSFPSPQPMVGELGHASPSGEGERLSSLRKFLTGKWTDNKLLAFIYAPWTVQSWVQATSETSNFIRSVMRASAQAAHRAVSAAHLIGRIALTLSPVAIASYVLRATAAGRMLVNECRTYRHAWCAEAEFSPAQRDRSRQSAAEQVDHARRFLRWKEATHRLAASARQLWKKAFYFVRNGPTALGTAFFKTVEFAKEFRPADFGGFATGVAAAIAKSFFSIFSAALSIAQGTYDLYQARRIRAAALNSMRRWYDLLVDNKLNLKQLAVNATYAKQGRVGRASGHALVFNTASPTDQRHAGNLAEAAFRCFEENQKRATDDARTEEFRAKARLIYGGVGLTFAVLTVVTGGIVGVVSALLSAVWITHSAYKYITKAKNERNAAEHAAQKKGQAELLTSHSISELDAEFEKNESLRENGYATALLLARYLVCEGSRGTGHADGDRVRRKLAADLLLMAGMNSDSLHELKIVLRDGAGLTEGVAVIEKYMLGTAAREDLLDGVPTPLFRSRSSVHNVLVDMLHIAGSVVDRNDEDPAGISAAVQKLRRSDGSYRSVAFKVQGGLPVNFQDLPANDINAEEAILNCIEAAISSMPMAKASTTRYHISKEATRQLAMKILLLIADEAPHKAVVQPVKDRFPKMSEPQSGLYVALSNEKGSPAITLCYAATWNARDKRHAIEANLLRKCIFNEKGELVDGFNAHLYVDPALSTIESNQTTRMSESIRRLLKSLFNVRRIEVGPCSMQTSAELDYLKIGHSKHGNLRLLHEHAEHSFVAHYV